MSLSREPPVRSRLASLCPASPTSRLGLRGGRPSCLEQSVVAQGLDQGPALCRSHTSPSV